MNKTEWKIVTAFTLLGIFAGYAGDTTTVEKLFLIGGPLLSWFFWHNLVGQLR